MEAIESDLKTFCFLAPRWQLYVIQGFLFSTFNWIIPLLESGKTPSKSLITIEQLMKHADPEFVLWPSDWVEPWLDRILELKLTLNDYYTFYENLDTLFRDCIPTDLNIFTSLSNGSILTDEQWDRLYEAVAFQAPLVQQKSNKTRRTQGRRAITPMKRRKAKTYHKPHVTVVKL
jgi:hypothetical protein